MLVAHLPPESATAFALRGKAHWSIEAHLLDDLRMALTGSEKKPPKPHPSRPKAVQRHGRPSEVALAKARQRRAARHRAIAAGEIP